MIRISSPSGNVFSPCASLIVRLTFGAAFLSATAFAQPSVAPVTPIVPTHLPQGFYVYADASPLMQARRLAANNDIPGLRLFFKQLLPLLCAATPPALPAANCSLQKNAYRFSFVGQLPATTVGLVSVFVDDEEERPIRLHGISGRSHPLVDVLLTDDPASKDAKYSSTTDSDPLATNALAFAAAVLGKIQLPTSTNVLGHGPGLLPLQTASAASGLTVSASILELPQSRATIKFEDAVVMPHSLLRALRWAFEVATSINAQIAAIQSPPQCLSDLNLALQTAVDTAITSCETKPEDCPKVLKDALAIEVDNAAAPCAGDVASLMSLRYAGLAGVLGTSFTAATSVPNVPATHLTFGVATARLSEPSFETGFARAKVGNDQKYVSDPMNRVVTLATVNWMMPRRLEDPWSRGLLGVFCGFALAPYFGPAAGFTIMIPKVPIAVVLGGTRLLIDQIEIDQLGKAGPDVNKQIPLKPGWASAWFFGASYVFNAAK